MFNLQEIEEKEVHKINLSCVDGLLFFNEPRKTKNIRKEVLALTQGRWKEAVSWWVCNSTHALGSNAKGFKFNLKKDVYINHPQGMGYKQMKSLSLFLEENGYVDIYKGYVQEWKSNIDGLVPETTMKSCMVLKDKAIDLFGDMVYNPSLWNSLTTNHLIVIRDSKTKNSIPTQGKRGVKKLREEMEEINSHLVGADIRYDGSRIADVSYRRVFSNSLDEGGRLYVAGGGVQLLPSDLRSEYLTIDGEPVAECDYSALHGMVLNQLEYNDNGMNIEEFIEGEYDPYGADLSFIKLDHQAMKQHEVRYGDKPNPYRELSKLALLIAFNADDRIEASHALGGKVFKDKQKDERNQKLVGIPDMKGFDFSRVLDAVEEHNSHIKHYMYEASWSTLQAIDSRIMANILGIMGAKGHTVLAYHDSCLVKESVISELEEAMWDAWRTIMGDTTFCRMKVTRFSQKK